MRKICYLLLIGLLVLGLTACSKDEKEEDNKRNATEVVTGTTTPAPTKDADVTEEVTPEVSPEETQAPTEAENDPEVTPSASPSPTEKAPEPTTTGEPDVTATPTEEPGTEPTGIENGTNTDIMTVAQAYYDYVRKSMVTNNYESAEKTRFGLALIDEDDIPELLIAENNHHGAGVKVVFYNNGDPKEVVPGGTVSYADRISGARYSLAHSVTGILVIPYQLQKYFSKNVSRSMSEGLPSMVSSFSRPCQSPRVCISGSDHVTQFCIK